MSTLNVGTGQQYSTVAAAVNASQAGDTIAVSAGTYTNDFVQIRHDLALQAVGGRVGMVATVAPSDGKAILTEGAAGISVSISGFDFSGARVADGNGAGIRYEGGRLTLDNTYFHDNENGLLAASAAGGSIAITNSEFSHNGVGDGRTHNIYVNDIASLTIDNSYFHDAVVGHEIKSRTQQTTITNSRIFDNQTGTASYSIDLPNGGRGVIRDNVIEQGPRSENPTVIAYGEEGGVYGGSSLQVIGNTIVNDLGRGNAVWNAAGAGTVLQDNSVFGFGGTALVNGPANVSGTTTLAAAPALNLGSPLTAIAGNAPASLPPAVIPPVEVPPVVILPPEIPPAVIPPVAAPPTPVAGDTFILRMSEDSWDGNAKFVLGVDGTQRGGVQTVTASHGAGASQTFDLTSLGLGAGLHDVSITFINDAYDSAGRDRNLFVDSVQFGSITQQGGPLWVNGSLNYIIGTPPVSANGAALVLNLSEDAYAGDASFTLSVDGIQRSIDQAVTAAHGAGASQAFDFTSLGIAPGRHDIGVTFTNDAYDGAGRDRNLFVDNVRFGDTTQTGGALSSNGTLNFQVG